MFHREIKVVVSLFVVLLIFTSCGTTRILGLQRQEVQKLLRNGDMNFIARAELPGDFSQAVARLTELTHIHPAAPFYAGLLVGAQWGASEQSRKFQTLLFAAALESPSLPARREATQRLAGLILETQQPGEVQDVLAFLSAANGRGRQDITLLRAAALYRLGYYNEAAALLPADPDGGWERALVLFAAWRDALEVAEAEFGGGTLHYTINFIADEPDDAPRFFISEAVAEPLRQEILPFLFALPAGDLRRWAYTEALSLEGLLTPGERGVIFSRRFPVSHAITLNNLRPALQDGGLLFFRFPSLIGDLARAYQFTPAMREEGVTLFTAWDSLLESGVLTASILTTGGNPNNPNTFHELNAFVNSLDNEAVDARRYLLLHHAGRIERARGRLAQSTEYFWQALALAPDSLQSDACIWYILMNTVVSDPSNAAPVFLSTIPLWTDMSVFNAVLDRLSRYLASVRDWDTLLEVFYALESRVAAGVPSSAALAQFAWISGRAIQEGFLTANRSAEDFFRIALNEPNGTFYYRTMAALSLGESFSPVRDTRRVSRRAASAPVSEGGELEFLLGFFDHGAAAFALPFIRARENDLAIPELRMVAQALAGAENWAESLRLTARFIRRPGHEISRHDLYLLHPRPYQALIERHSREMGIGPEIMFGLIRTESFFAAGVSSHAGAVGLAQLMPATAQDIAVRMVRAGGPDLRNPNGIDLTNPEINVQMGAFYLRHLINNQMEGCPVLGLMAYNGGQGRVRRWVAADREREDGALPIDLFLETVIYPETRNYGRLVLAAAAIYGYLYYGRTMEEVAASIFRQRTL